MPSNIITGAKMYTSAVKNYPYMHSLYAQAIADPTKFKYSQFGEETMVREIIGVSAGTYSGMWNDTEDEGSGWTAHAALFDREISFNVGAVEEMNAILAGMELTGLLKAKASWKRMGPEIDAVSCSYISANIQSGNAIAAADLPMTKTGIVDSLISLRQQVYDLGYYGEIAVMLDSESYGNLTSNFFNAGGLVSGAMLSKTSKTFAATDKDYFQNTLEFTGDVHRFMDNMYIYNVPKASMHNKVTLLDKKSVGQEAGGFVAATGAVGYHAVKCQVIPLDAAALSVRHLVGEIAVPQRFMDIQGFDIKSELDAMNEMYDGVTMVENIGVNQLADSFRYLNRILYGPTTFETQKHLMFEVY